MEFLLIVVLIRGVFGAIAALIASNKGRSGVAWFIIGFLLGLLGLIIALVVGDLKKASARRNRLQRENRRLREQIRSNRSRDDRRNQQLDRRVDAHDRVRGIDTAPASRRRVARTR